MFIASESLKMALLRPLLELVVLLEPSVQNPESDSDSFMNFMASTQLHGTTRFPQTPISLLALPPPPRHPPPWPGAQQTLLVMPEERK